MLSGLRKVVSSPPCFPLIGSKSQDGDIRLGRQVDTVGSSLSSASFDVKIPCIPPPPPPLSAAVKPCDLFDDQRLGTPEPPKQLGEEEEEEEEE